MFLNNLHLLAPSFKIFNPKDTEKLSTFDDF
jgi:hypothetical protein